MNNCLLKTKNQKQLSNSHLMSAFLKSKNLISLNEMVTTIVFEEQRNPLEEATTRQRMAEEVDKKIGEIYKILNLDMPHPLKAEHLLNIRVMQLPEFRTDEVNIFEQIAKIHEENFYYIYKYKLTLEKILSLAGDDKIQLLGWKAEPAHAPPNEIPARYFYSPVTLDYNFTHLVVEPGAKLAAFGKESEENNMEQMTYRYACAKKPRLENVFKEIKKEIIDIRKSKVNYEDSDVEYFYITRWAKSLAARCTPIHTTREEDEAAIKIAFPKIANSRKLTESLRKEYGNDLRRQRGRPKKSA